MPYSSDTLQALYICIVRSCKHRALDPYMFAHCHNAPCAAALCATAVCVPLWLTCAAPAGEGRRVRTTYDISDYAARILHIASGFCHGLSPLDLNNALKGCRISTHHFPPHMSAFDWHPCTSSSFTCCISCALLPDLLCCLLCVVACFVLSPALLCCNKPCPRKAGGSISSASDGVVHLTWGHLLDSYHEETSEVPLGSPAPCVAPRPMCRTPG